MDLLIHYGASKYEPNLVKPIINSNWVKPKGGLWTSPINSEWGWKHWCESENFRECNKENSFILELYDWAKVYIIDNIYDLLNLPNIQTSYSKYLDYEKIAKKYDAIWLTEEGQWKTRLSEPMNLYGWDCESVLILNSKCCYELIKNNCNYQNIV